MSLRRQSAFSRLAMLASALVLFLCGTALFSAPRASAACSLVELCVETDSGGTAHLNVPPLAAVALFKPELEPLEDCIWNRVEVNFGDGSPPGIYVWNAAVGLTGSHTFPHPGEYPVHIDATEGHHGESKTVPQEPCPDLPIDARVVFPAPSTTPPLEIPTGGGGSENGGGGEKGNGGKGKGGGHQTGAGGGNSTGQAGEEGESGKGSILRWQHCPPTEIYAHLVTCGKARKVIKGAQAVFPERRAVRVDGFRCKFDRSDLRPITCRRGKSQVLGPLG